LVPARSNSAGSKDPPTAARKLSYSGWLVSVMAGVGDGCEEPGVPIGPADVFWRAGIPAIDADGELQPEGRPTQSLNGHLVVPTVAKVVLIGEVAGVRECLENRDAGLIDLIVGIVVTLHAVARITHLKGEEV
jgi:hypothetical protein